MLQVLRRMVLLLVVTLLLSPTIVACSGDDAAAPAEEAPVSDVVDESADEPADAEDDAAAEVEGEGDGSADEESAADADAEAADDVESDDADGEMEGMIAKLNLNTASTDEFQMVPDVGERMAREFDEYRPYASIAEFRKEMSKYVDDEAIAGYEEYVFVPVSANDSDAATLMQLPGVDEAVADALIAGRPYDSFDAFFAALAELVSVDDVAAAAGYMSLE